MILEILPTGLWGSNCYIIGDNKEGVIIDPGAEASDIIKAVEKASLKIKYIILTHAHVDHIISMDEVREAVNAKVVMHEADIDTMEKSFYNGAVILDSEITFQNADLFVKDGDILEVGGMKLEIIHTPGHTPGCICIKTGNYIFTGDTLFRLAIGRTDLGNGNYDNIINSIKNRLMTLDDSVVVYPGHNSSTTIGDERESNPFLR